MPFVSCPGLLHELVGLGASFLHPRLDAVRTVPHVMRGDRVEECLTPRLDIRVCVELLQERGEALEGAFAADVIRTPPRFHRRNGHHFTHQIVG